MAWLQQNASWILELMQLAVISAAAVFAYLQVKGVRETSSRRSTIEFIRETENDNDVIMQRARFLKLRNSRHNHLAQWIDLQQDREFKLDYIANLCAERTFSAEDEKQQYVEQLEAEIRDNNEAIRGVLNRYEILAIGIFTRSLDEEMVKRFQRTTMITDWNKTKEYIEKLRTFTNSPHTFIEFQKLAVQWEAQVLEQDMRQREIK